MSADKISTLSGIVPPLVTPLTSGRLDQLGLERLLEFVMCEPLGGVFLLGTTGEGPALADAVKRAVIDESIGIIAQRLPVLVGVSDPSLDGALRLARWSAEAGADAVVATPPFYFPLEQSAIRAWFERFADASPLPVMLYNFPALAKSNLSVETVKALMDHDNIAGIKDSHGDLDQFREYCELARQRPEWRVFMGPEQCIADAMALGAHGGVAGGANVRPRLFTDLYRACCENDQPTIERANEEMKAMHQRIYGDPITCQSVVCGLKRELESLKICSAESTWDLRLEAARISES